MDKEQGYITICNSADIPGLKEAGLLARSIKINDKNRKTCLVTDNYDHLPKFIEKNFDYIVELPYGYVGEDDFECNMWQIYYCTPFEENIFMRKRSLLLNNVDGIWENLTKTDICFPISATNFKNEISDFRYFFESHDKNNVPKLFTDIFYFKKSLETSEFFKMLDPIMQNWRSVYVNLIKEKKPEYFHLNLVINITVKLLGVTNTNVESFLYHYISLENVDIDDIDLPDDWTRYLSCWVQNKTVKINNHKLNNFVFYNSPSFIDDEILDDFAVRSN